MSKNKSSRQRKIYKFYFVSNIVQHVLDILLCCVTWSHTFDGKIRETSSLLFMNSAEQGHINSVLFGQLGLDQRLRRIHFAPLKCPARA